jgi:hypothetical protein
MTKLLLITCIAIALFSPIMVLFTDFVLFTDGCVTCSYATKKYHHVIATAIFFLPDAGIFLLFKPG